MRRILIGSDFSNNHRRDGEQRGATTPVIDIEREPEAIGCAQRAAVEGTRIAAQCGAGVIFMHAQPPLGGDVAVAERLERLCADYRERGGRAQYRVVQPPLDDALAEAAVELDVDLVVVGGRAGANMAAAAPCSVLVVQGAGAGASAGTGAGNGHGVDRGNGNGGYHHVLVPTDFSESAERGYCTALELSARGATIELLHCWSPPNLLAVRGSPMPLTRFAEDMAQAVRARAGALLARHPPGGRQVKVASLEGAAVVGIQARLEQESWDLVVLGSHGHRGVRRWLLGSVAEETLKQAQTSVLVVHPPRMRARAYA